jgi:hypothetical protein
MLEDGGVAMPEIDLRGNQRMAELPREEQLVSRELYQLLTIFAASPKLAELQQSDQGGCVYSWSVRSFEYPEIARVLVSLAAMLRNDWDANPARVEGNLSMFHPNSEVGVLIPNLEKPTRTVPLKLRESLNKILHAYTINLDRSQGPSIYDGHLNPRIHLYGDREGVQWKATLEVYRWAEMVHSIS